MSSVTRLAKTSIDHLRLPNGMLAHTEKDREPIRAAFFNVTVFLLAVFFILGTFAAYFLFYEFVKPMIWALIAGIILFPLKRKLVRWVRGWLNYLYIHRTPLSVGVFTLPYNIVMELGDFILELAGKNLKAVFLIGASFPACSLILYYETIPKLLLFLKRLAQNIDTFMSIFRGLWVPTAFLGYIIYIFIFNFLLPQSFKAPALINVMKSRPVSFSVWTATLAYACGFFGPFATPAFCLIIILCSTYYFAPGFGSLLNDNDDQAAPETEIPSSSKKNVLKVTKGGFKKFLRRKNADSNNLKEKSENSAPTLNVPEVPPVTSQTSSSDFSKYENSVETKPETNTNDKNKQSESNGVNEEQEGDNEANVYLKYLLFGCFFVWISLHLWIMFLLLIPIGLALIKRLLVAFNVSPFISKVFGSVSVQLENDFEVLLPSPLRHLLQVFIRVDRQVIYWLRQSLDIVGSFAAMFILIFIAAGLTGFVTFQLYYESLHLISLITNIANQTLTNNLAFQNWLQTSANVTSVTELTDKSIQKAYDMGRNWLSAQVHDIIPNDEEKARLLETQIVTTLDTFFNSWVAKRNNSVTSAVGLGDQLPSQKSAISQWNNVWSAIEEENWNFLDYFQEYITVVWTIADSAWLLIKNNMEILLMGLSQMMSTIIASGSAVVDFFLDSIVFFTFLMFLLSSSDDEYKPMKLIRDLVPSGRDVAVKLTEEMEEAVSSVFLATFKMTIFYGMFTWLTHTLFAVNIVFIPSVLAAIFAAVPFFGTYIVAIPAIMELWLIRGEPFLAILMFIVHYLPSYMVDDAIYSEIRLTTPFVTGMAITGGMLWWGLEGAIFGPLVLCCLLVTGAMYMDMFSHNALFH